MEQKRIIIFTIIFALLVALMFAYAHYKKAELTNGDKTISPTSETNTNDRYGDITRIDAKHFYIDGVHTLVGEIPFPTPCDLLNWDTSIAESAPEIATVAFSVVNHAENCAQTVTAQRFKVTLSASKDAEIRATLDGRRVDLNLIPAGPGETPDSYELFIKG